MTSEIVNYKSRDFYQQTLDAIIADMQSLGTYKPEFDRVIEIYAQVYIEYLVIGDQWRRSGYQVTEEYTNKAGATNKQQSTLYKTVQQAREKLQYYESCLGLTPAALKRINEKLDNRDGKGSKLDEVLDKIEQINVL